MFLCLAAAVINSGRAPADGSGNVFYTAPSSIGQVASTVPCPAGYYCPGGASVLTPAGLPQQCTKNLSSTAGSDSTEDCNSKLCCICPTIVSSTRCAVWMFSGAPAVCCMEASCVHSACVFPVLQIVMGCNTQTKYVCCVFLSSRSHPCWASCHRYQ